MTDYSMQSDLVVLTADKNMKYAVEGLLNRPEALKIRPVRWSVYIHPESDPGCLLRSDTFLRSFVNRYSHAIVMFDREGSGCQSKARREELEEEVACSLARNGWQERASAIVIDPELENWVFSDSPEVDAAIGWKSDYPSLRGWLKEKGFYKPGRAKPFPPKEALEAALRYARMPRSSYIYGRLAERVGLGRCTDRAFQKLKETLQSWFPVHSKKRQNF